MEWFKFYAEEYLSDTKIRSLPPLHQHCWTYILALAASQERDGFIPFLTEETLMSTAGLVWGTDEWERTQGVLKLFEIRKMITIETEGVTVVNWLKKQGSALSSYERVKRFREKKRNETERNVMKHENDNNRIEENRINTIPASPEKDLEKEISGDDFQVEAEEDMVPSRDLKNNNKPPRKMHRQIFSLFTGVQPFWFKSRQMIDAADRLYNDKGVEKCKKALAFFNENKDEKFCPQVYTPIDLEEKWTKLATFRDKQEE